MFTIPMMQIANCVEESVERNRKKQKDIQWNSIDWKYCTASFFFYFQLSQIHIGVITRWAHHRRKIDLIDAICFGMCIQRNVHVWVCIKCTISHIEYCIWKIRSKIHINNCDEHYTHRYNLVAFIRWIWVCVCVDVLVHCMWKNSFSEERAFRNLKFNDRGIIRSS